ncbi:BnaC06g42150D [Brassica napus]|uniref:BnaC06g42150D protein n=3 Tax=Brassica TaxID=3705 RepID=A0A078IM79_BRANA|nr:BnaC06g42150D [Brassica napus]
MNMLIHIGAESPKFQRKGEGSCSIFKIPQSLKKNHQKGYEPEIVSIGPYDHGKEHLQMLEEHKHRYLKLFLGEAKDGVDTNTLGRKILQMETAIRNSYSEKLVVIKPEFLKMMLLDDTFLQVRSHQNDRILTTPWILSTIRSDLLLLENQVPLILLNTLLKESNISKNVNLETLAFKFFNLSVAEKTKSQNFEAEHLLDLIRKNFINGTSQSPEKAPSNSHYDDSRLILSANRLRLQGIKFKASTNVPRRSSREETILDIKLNGNELHIYEIYQVCLMNSSVRSC